MNDARDQELGASPPVSTADLAQAEGRGRPSTDADLRHREATPLLPSDEVATLRDRWSDVQAGFVDEPRRAVQEADTLVASTMQRLAQVFADERATLESQWSRGNDVSTEDLRLALQRYRSFFGRLLSF